MMRTQMTKRHLLEIMRAERERWEDALFAIGERRMTCPGLAGEWSARDVVAHTTAYERWLVAWLEALARGETPAPSPLDDADVARRERAAIEATRSFPLDLVLGDSWLTWERLSLAVERISEDDLEDASRAPLFVRKRWGAATALWQAIAHLTYERYREHIAAFQAWTLPQAACS